jgi:hypothetical protein
LPGARNPKTTDLINKNDPQPATQRIIDEYTGGIPVDPFYLEGLPTPGAIKLYPVEYF